jgi:DNA-binding GntR family transcriptional regulator
MARAARPIVQGERLRDQVYRRLREDLQSGALAPGARLVELQLAAALGVSRTPVREALVQLSREGVLSLQDRGYIVRVDTQKDVIDRLEARRLLDARIARHAALEATAEQIKALTKALDRQSAAHAAGRHKAFVQANIDFRKTVRAMCRNSLLARCAAMVDDQFQTARSQIHASAENRAVTLDCDRRIAAAIIARDPDAAEAAVEAFMITLYAHFGVTP